MTVRSREDLKQSLMARAFEQGREQEVYEEIQRRIERSNITPEHRALLDTFNQLNEEQPQALRALNVIAEMEGLETRYLDAQTLPVIEEDDFDDVPEEEKIAFIPPEPK